MQRENKPESDRERVKGVMTIQVRAYFNSIASDTKQDSTLLLTLLDVLVGLAGTKYDEDSMFRAVEPCMRDLKLQSMTSEQLKTDSYHHVYNIFQTENFESVENMQIMRSMFDSMFTKNNEKSTDNIFNFKLTLSLEEMISRSRGQISEIQKYMRSSSYHPGRESLLAIKNMHKLNILMLHEIFSPIFVGGFNEKFSHTICLASRPIPKNFFKKPVDTVNWYDRVISLL